MRAVFSLAVVVILVLIAQLGAGAAGMHIIFGIVLPYAAIAVFLLGMVYRVVNWARSPVPFRIPTTCGQERSLPWVKQNKLDNPDSTLGVIGRMALEILLFRSLFRNTKTELKNGPTLVYGASKYLWVGALAFHWSFLVIFVRHFKFFTEPVPQWVLAIQSLDGLFEIGLPILYVTDVVILAALTYLLFRRLLDSRLRYISLAGDYFPLFLILGIAVTGVLMRYFTKTDIVAVKELAIGLVTFSPPGSAVLGQIGSIFYIHLFLVTVLFLYFPFSKLVHLGGVFMSPTRNLANNNRMKRHLNPWDYPVKIHTYEEWEDEFRDVMKACGLPLEKE